MQFLLENSWMVGGLGFAISLATAYGWIQTGRKEALFAAAGILVLTIILIVVSMQVETDGEAIRKMIYQTADDVENNRRDAVLKRIHPSAVEILERARAEIQNYEFNRADVTQIHEITVNSKAQPAQATVKMNIIAGGSFSGFTSNGVPRYVEFTLYKSGKEWMVFDYSHSEPLAGFREKHD